MNERNKKRVRVGVRARERIKTPEERKKEKQSFIRNMYRQEIQKQIKKKRRNKEMYNNS